MPTPVHSRRRTIADGRALLAAWQSSGLSVRAYALAHRLSPDRIVYWRRRLRKLDQQPGAQTGFVEIPPPALPSAASTVTITLPNGLSATVPPGSDLAWLTRVVATLLPLEALCPATKRSSLSPL
jgi:hypothetical protein